MDIKTRIDGLSEAEAKAALEWHVIQLSMFQAVYQESWNLKVTDMDALMESTLDRALKEARE